MKIGSLIEFAVDPIFPELIREGGLSAAKEKCKMRIGVVVAEPNEEGYIKVCVTPHPDGWGYEKDEFTIHTDYCVEAVLENGKGRKL